MGEYPYANPIEQAVYRGEIDQKLDAEKTTETSAITPDIPLGVGGGKILFSCETGVYNFVKELADDNYNGLPNKMTGILMKYLTDGIEREFSRTWDRTPSSIKTLQENKATYEPKKKAPSKAYKNELIAKSHYDYYAKDVEDGEISREEATKLMFKAIDEIKELEDAGFVISKNKTAGVKTFDADAEVNSKYDDDKNRYLFYKSNNYEIVVPHLMDYQDGRKKGEARIQRYETQIQKCNILNKKQKAVDPFITKLHEEIEKWKEKNEYINLHLVKKTLMGQQKPRYVCYEGKNKQTGLMSLLIAEYLSETNEVTIILDEE